MTSHTKNLTGAAGLAGAGLLLGVGGAMHPRVDTAVEFDEGLAGMFRDAAWSLSHGLTVAGLVLLTLSLTLLRPALGSRRLGWAAVAGAGIAAVESVPHLLAKSEAGALLAGDSTPLTDVHALLQIVATPALGLSVAALALTGALGAGRVAAVPAVLGGLSFAAAGPAIAITENSDLSPLFTGAAGMAIWFVVAGVRSYRSISQTFSMTSAEKATSSSKTLGRPFDVSEKATRPLESRTT